MPLMSDRDFLVKQALLSDMAPQPPKTQVSTKRSTTRYTTEVPTPHHKCKTIVAEEKSSFDRLFHRKSQLPEVNQMSELFPRPQKVNRRPNPNYLVQQYKAKASNGIPKSQTSA